jgi:hypothetical protein
MTLKRHCTQNPNPKAKDFSEHDASASLHANPNPKNILEKPFLKGYF